MISEKLENRGYSRIPGYKKAWRKGDRVIHVVDQSDGMRDYIRITWMESWKNDYAIIYNYTGINLPVCIVPVSVLCASEFLTEKRKQLLKKKDKKKRGQWFQEIPRILKRKKVNYELATLVLRFKDRWDLL